MGNVLPEKSRAHYRDSFMPAETLNCPMCGAAASSEATACEHCGARLATVACPSCFGMMFVGEKFCSHCGAKAQREELPVGIKSGCPRCATGLEAVAVGDVNLRECPKCAGVWLDVKTMEKICADPARQTAVLGIPGPPPELASGDFETMIRYVPCPVCKTLMNRVCFASHSRVIVDVCKGHGTWFDRDELRRVVEFIRAGGLEKARKEEMAILAAKPSTRLPPDVGSVLGSTPDRSAGVDLGDVVSICADLASWLMRR